MPMQNLLLLAELKALGVCQCRIYYFWQNCRCWVCAHAEFITFGRTEGIGCVPMQNMLLLAELKAFGVCPCRRIAGIGRVPMRNVILLAELKALGVCLSTRQELPHHRSRGARAGLPRPCGLGQRANKGGRVCVHCTTGHCTCCGIVLLWPSRDRRQPLLRGWDLAYDTMTPCHHVWQCTEGHPLPAAPCSVAVY